MNSLRSSENYSPGGESLKPFLESRAAGLETTVSFISGAFPMLQLHRRIDGKDFFWLVNNQEQKQVCDLKIQGVKGTASIWDCETGSIRQVTSSDTKDGANISLTFKPLEAFWLVFDPASDAGTVAEDGRFIKLIDVTGTWKVTYNPDIQPVMEFSSVPAASFASGVEKPLVDWKAWGLEKFSGLLEYTRSVNIESIDKQMIIDLGKVCHVAEVWINGQPAGARMWGPYVFDISTLVKPGLNEIRIRIANLINNSYGDLQESGLLGPVQILNRE